MFSRLDAREQTSSEDRVAVIDIGSNSCRLIVTQLHAPGCLEVLEEVQSPVRLVRGLGPSGQLSDEAIDRLILTLLDFQAVASHARPTRTIALATSAMRDARNAPRVVERIRSEIGIDVEVIPGDREAYLGFRGAVQSLPAQNGLLVDIGGGSLEVCEFRAREAQRTWTLPLGALRLSDRFFHDDPPSPSQVRKLRRYIEDQLARAALPRLGQADETMVGTGGTIRNLARADLRAHPYPIAGLHGYNLGVRSVQALVERLLSLNASARGAIPGISRSRVDSIHGGGLALLLLMEAVSATTLTISGHGLREGAAYASLTMDVPTARAVRDASVATFTAGFATWDPARARARQTLAEKLLDAVLPGGDVFLAETLAHAAAVLDVGRAADYYRRYAHTASLLQSALLPGFSHRQMALLAATIVHIDEDRVRLKPFSPLLGPSDRPSIALLSTVLALAEEIERRCSSNPPQVRIERRGRGVRLVAPVPVGDWFEPLAARLKRASKISLRLAPERMSEFSGRSPAIASGS